MTLKTICALFVETAVVLSALKQYFSGLPNTTLFVSTCK
jgi:hypothetical protein